MKYRKTVAGVVHQHKEFLLVQKPHWNGWWDFAQGGVEPGEYLSDALMRELKEELGTDRFSHPVYTSITLRRIFSPETLAHYPQNNRFIGKDIYYFIVKFLGNREDIVLGDDLSDRLWCNDKNLLELIYKAQLHETKQIIEFMKERNIL